MPHDADLLRAYAESRDQAAFAEFVRRNVDLVYAAAYRQTGWDAHLAKDIVQSVFVAAARRASRLACHPVIPAWLHQTTRHVAIDAARARRRRQAREAAAAGMIAAETGSSAADWDRISPELDRVLGRLAERDRAALLLRFFGGKSFGEIGGELGLTEGAARMRVERALEKLRLGLSRTGITSSAAALAILLVQQGVMAAPAGLGGAVTAAAMAASVSGGTAGSISFIMTTGSKITLGLAVLAALVGMGTAWRESQTARRSEAALVAANRQNGELRHQLAQLAVEMRTKAAAAKPTGSPAPPRTVIDGSSWDYAVTFLRTQLSPSTAPYRKAIAQANFASKNADLLRFLRLSPTQVGQLRDLLVERDMEFQDVRLASAEQHLDPAGAARATAQVQAGIEFQVESVLGQAVLARYQYFQQTQMQRPLVQQLQASLSFTDSPLTDEQGERLVRLFRDENTPAPGAITSGEVIRPGEPGYVEGKVTYKQPTLLTDPIMDRAQSLLSPSQFEALAAIQRQQQATLQEQQAVTQMLAAQKAKP